MENGIDERRREDAGDWKGEVLEEEEKGFGGDEKVEIRLGSVSEREGSGGGVEYSERDVGLGDGISEVGGRVSLDRENEFGFVDDNNGSAGSVETQVVGDNNDSKSAVGSPVVDDNISSVDKAGNGQSEDVVVEMGVSAESNGDMTVPNDESVGRELEGMHNGIRAESVASEVGGEERVPTVLPGLEMRKQDEEEGSVSKEKSKGNGGFEKESGTVKDANGSRLSNEEVNDRAPPRPASSNGEFKNGSDSLNGNGEVPVRPPAASASSGKDSATSTRSLPAGLGSSASLLDSASRSVQHPRANGSAPQRPTQQPSDEFSNGDGEEYDETREKLQMIRVKFLRLAHRLGQTPHNVVVAQVLYRLGLAEQLRGSMNTSRAGAFSFDRASAMAEQLEAAGQKPLDFSCTIMVIGKTGVGKSATINSIFDEMKFKTDAFRLGTTKVQDIIGTVQGIKLRVIDTPGLSPSSSDQPKNERILNNVKRFIKKTPPDVVMYLDRLDMQNRDHGDVPLLRTITDVFGPSIWFNAIVVLTHAASAPPEGPNGTPISYEMYVTQRSHVIQQAVRQAAGDPRLLNPVSLVENHSACRMNRAGQRVLPNGQVWKPHLLLLSFASKILTEANTLLKLQDGPVNRPFGARSRGPPLPFLLSSLLQSRAQLKLPDDQLAGDDSMDWELDEESEGSDSGDEYEYDELPPFKCLTKEQISKLSKDQRKAYYEELDYREKLFFKKQMKEEKKRRRFFKKMVEAAKDLPRDHNTDNVEEESAGPASVPVAMPDLSLPASFDSDYPSHRYRSLDSGNQWLVRPVLENQGWDHDVGYEGLNVEKLFVVKDKVPLSLSGQLTKDKKEFTLQMEVASSIKHGEGKATSVGMDLQSVGKDMAYTLHGETKINNFRRNTTTAGVSATVLGDTTSAGVKVEDKLIVSKRFDILMAGGAMSSRGDVAYGGRLEATLRDKDYLLGRALSTLALSVLDWHGDLAINCNLQSQLPVGRHTNVSGHANLSNKGTGQVSVRISSSEQLQLALIALVPIFRNVKRYLSGSSDFM